MYISRKIEGKIRNHIPRKEYTIITGARQSGKTSLVRRLFAEMRESNPKVFFVTLEDKEALFAINENPENIFRYAARPDILNKAPGSGVQVFIFIDEIQYASDPSNFLKYLYDKYLDTLKIIATGSSAFYIDSSFNDSLAGRKRLFTLRTLSFEEFLIFKGKDALSGELALLRNQPDYQSIFKNELLTLLDEFLVYGGYPEVVLENDLTKKKELLKEIKDSFLKRDIDGSGVSNSEAFYKLFTLLAGQTGSLLNKNELSNTIGVDNKTIDKYLAVLQKHFHIGLVKPFSTNLRKELTRMPKIYFYDPGMRNILLNRFSDFHQREDQGALVENFVFCRLEELHGTDLIKFWRTADGKEVDFVLTSDYETGSAFEVKTNCKKGSAKGFRKFGELYPGFSLEWLTYQFCEDSRQLFKI